MGEESISTCQPEKWTLNRDVLSRVYRFALCLAGAVPAAQALVERIYQRALVDGILSSSEASQNPEDLLALACQEITPDLLARSLPAQAVKEPGSNGFDLQVYQVADGLARLEPGQAALLALRYFGGVGQSVAASVLGISPRRAERALLEGFHRWLIHVQPAAAQRGPEVETRFAADLACFAESILLQEEWVRRLEQRLLSSRVGSSPAQLTHPSSGGWRKALNKGLGQTGWSLSRRAAALVGSALMILILALSFELTPREGQLRATPKTAQSVIAPERDPAFIDLLQGKWVPPAASACEAWRLRVAALTGASAQAVPLSALPAAARNETGPGWACRVSAEVPAAAVQEMRAELADQLIADGFVQQVGSGQFVSPGRMVRLTVSAPADCPAESGCSDQQASIILEAAEDRLGERIAGFLALWQAGGEADRTHLFLAGPLAKKYPDTASLDKLVGISRALGREPSLTWRMLENTGQFARIEVSARTLLDRDVFQMIWSLEGDQWVAAALDREILFPATQDRLIAADPDGRVVLVDLDSGVQRILTPPGVYLPGGENSRLRPALSPDGKWLAVVAAGQEAITYLVGLETEQQFRIPHKAVAFAWSPDSQSLALVAADRPAWITHFELATHVVSYNCEQKGSIHSLTWSPDGSWLAMTLAQTHKSLVLAESAQLDRLLIRVVTPGCRQPRTVHALFSSLNQDDLIQPTPYDLAWAEDSTELWYRGELSILLKNNAVRPVQQVTGYVDRWFEEWASLYEDYYSLPDSHNYGGNEASGGQLSAKVFSEAGTGSPSYEVQVFGPNEEFFVSQPASGPLEQLGWTIEGGSLVLSEKCARSSRILRLNPYSGETIEVAAGLDMIALTSELHLLANRHAPAEPPQRAVVTWMGANKNKWPLFESLSMGIALRTPPGWAVIRYPGLTVPNQVTISNIQLENVNHPVRLERADISIHISSQPWQNGVNLPTYIHQAREQTEGPEDHSLLQETAVAGRVAFQIEDSLDSTTGEKLLYIPTEMGLLTLTIQPADTYRVDWFAAMLETVNFTDIGEMPVARGLTEKEVGLIAEIRAASDPLPAEWSIRPVVDDLQIKLARWECALLSDGNSYAYQRLGLGEYWKNSEQHSLAQNLSRCQDPSALSIGRALVSPSHETLFYTMRAAPHADACTSVPELLFALNRPSGNWWSQMETSARMVGQDPVWDPYSGRIVVWLGGHLRLLTPEGALESYYIAGEPDWQPGPIFWSPDGTQIAYLRYQPGCPARGAVFLQNLDGAEPIRIGDNVTALHWTDANQIRMTLAGGSSQVVTPEAAQADIIQQRPPEPQDSSSFFDDPELYKEIQSVLNEAESQQYLSPDGRWSAELTTVGCRFFESIWYQASYHRLRLLDGSGKFMLVLYEEIEYCWGEPTEFQFLGWSPDSRYLYYSTTTRWIGWTCNERELRTIRVNIENGLQVELPGNRQVSPDGSALAWRSGVDLFIWPQNGEPIRRLDGVFEDTFTQSLAWLADGKTLIAIESPDYCMPCTPGKVLEISLETGEIKTIYAPASGGPALENFLGEHSGWLYIQDFDQGVWRLDPATGKIERAAWPVPPE